MKLLRLALYFVVGLLLGGSFTLSYAGNFQSYQGSAFRTINGTTYWKGDAGSFAQSKATVMESVKVGGTYITVPTFAQVTGAMVAVGMGAIRMSPGIAGVAVISYLASKGIELVDGQWKKKGTTGPDVSTWDQTSAPNCDQISTGQWLSRYASGVVNTYTRAASNFHCGSGVPAGMREVNYCKNPSGSACIYDAIYKGTACPTGTGLVGGVCQTESQYQPAGDSDWDAVNGVTPPDEVMRGLCQALANYNTSTPGCAMYNAKTEKASVAMSDWAYNPNTGKDERQVATWTPRPTPEDPFAGEVSVKTESKDASAATDPTTGDTVNPSDTSSKDNTKDTPFCTLYPESLACAKMGTPEKADKLESKTMGVESITIQTFGSSATCPSPIRLPHGSELSFEWPCRMAEGVKPFLLALAWLAAGLIVIGAMRND